MGIKRQIRKTKFVRGTRKKAKTIRRKSRKAARKIAVSRIPVRKLDKKLKFSKLRKKTNRLR